MTKGGSRLLIQAFGLMPAALLASCASLGGGDQPILGISWPRDASSVMLTSTTAAEVAACIARVTGSESTVNGTDFQVTTRDASPVTYRIRTISDPYARYMTQVDQLGRAADSSPNPSGCVQSASDQAPVT